MFVVGPLITSLLVVRGVRAGILIGVAVTTVIAIVVEAIVRVGPSMGTNPQGWALSVPALPDSVLGVPDLSLVGAVAFGASGIAEGARQRRHRGADHAENVFVSWVLLAAAAGRRRTVHPLMWVVAVVFVAFFAVGPIRALLTG